jgi:hypothetical protein
VARYKLFLLRTSLCKDLSVLGSGISSLVHGDRKHGAAVVSLCHVEVFDHADN